ncbi:MAG TPA: undecaprenyldiphospho-muramoylpentapeptide beta-N-acetylglucosaminyltransferase [Pyrinomonadaceae bacterium]|jgi:UDP-N-acetylglucosamine--N-acetylmuramyl-(pentapeptide) pyrophosphoryl-undecaprenol N-acetylglucosamine transferase|nr:undecaprenyldiphospho-muramoylpentapeptide beta-N-acetylglucosaminyltransferase [Pyrinomonadaceae bacterium]
MRVLIAAGGTGGHIYPGIAVAKEIMRRHPGSEIRFVGTARGLEIKLVPQAGFELSLIDSAGLKNVGLIARARGFLVLPKSFLAARSLIRAFRPDVVIGAGGYVSGPVVLTAALLKLPTLVMESNALPGVTNRTLARFVDKAAVSFDAALPYFRGKAVVTGNPVRREFFEIAARQRQPGQFSVLVFGGSQGARAINEAMIAALPSLASVKAGLRITHQTGEADFAKVSSGYAEAGWSDQADVRKYIENMVDSFRETDLVICRAGATTTAELIAAGKASIMIPFPLAADDHQRRNAEALEVAGAGKMILQQDLSGERLAKEITSLASDPERLATMEQAARKLARGDAAAAVVNMVEELVGRGRKPVGG